jgi:hypothetical protein
MCERAAAGTCLGSAAVIEQGCFVHEVAEWRSITLGTLGGRVHAAHDGPTEPGIPNVDVYARSWPRGVLLHQRTGSAGEFMFPGAATGKYEVAVCMSGWNPWRGIVEVASRAARREGEFPIALGQWCKAGSGGIGGGRSRSHCPT